MTTTGFSHFSPDMLAFLVELEANNERAWFADNKTRYESDVREPCLDFITAMAQPLAAISPHFVAWPRKSGGSLMRIYRDVRFARDKRPYKTNVGIQFRHEAGKDVHAPGYYLHIDPHQAFVGVGAWRPAPDALGAVRQRIADFPDKWLAARDAPEFSLRFSLGGETLIRPPRGFDAEHPCIEDIKRKDFIAIAALEPESLFEPGLVDRITGQFRRADAFMRFLCTAAGVRF